MPTKKQARREATSTASQTPDPRAPIKVSAASMKAASDDVREIVARLEPPPEPGQNDLVYALMHASFLDGLPCGYAQEVSRRLEVGYVDRNELRVTEAFELAESLEDLGMDHLFERCMAMRDSIAQIYNDQNSVSLEFLREATITERNQFFARVPAVQAPAERFLVQLLAFEECIFSDRSIVRVQARLGFDPKSTAAQTMFGELKEILTPFGHIPLRVGPDGAHSKPITDPPLCAACRLMRLATPAKK